MSEFEKQIFMPQHIFDAGVVSVALCAALEEDDLTLAKSLGEEYGNSYDDDAQELAVLFLSTGRYLLSYLPDLFAPQPLPKEQMAGVCLNLYKAMTQLDLNGKRKKNVGSEEHVSSMKRCRLTDGSVFEISSAITQCSSVASLIRIS